ncbi:MAG: carboxypeptidase-like regulatory domain-containing protein [Myxococcota bacterium]
MSRTQNAPESANTNPRLQQRRRTQRTSGVLAVLTLLIAGCGGGGGSGQEGAGGVSAVSSLPAPVFARTSANPAGIALPGAPTDNALGSIGWMESTPALPEDLTSTGVLLDRLLTVVAPEATVEEINLALAAQGATILSMSGGNPFLVLRIPRAADEAAVRVLADALAASDAFLFSQPLRGQPIEPGVSPIVPASAVDNWHWDALDLWAAWNLGERPNVGNPVRVFSFDDFDSTNLTPGTSAMQIQLGAGGVTLGAKAGLHALSQIAGAIDSATPGVASDQAVLVVGVTKGYLSAIEIIHSIAFEVGDTELDRFVLRTAWNYLSAEEEFDLFSRGDRALDALVWRIVLATTPQINFSRVLHIVPVGESLYGDADAGLYQSPWATSSSYANLLDFASEGGASESDKVRTLWNVYASSNPAITEKSFPPLLIGALTETAERVSGTAGGSDLDLPGQFIPGACLIDCDSAGIVSLSGVDVASSLAAGAAAFFWDIKPDLTPEQVAVFLTTEPDGGGFLNLYEALLLIDSDVDIVNAPARMRLLDVAGATLGSIQPNGLFDEVDLETFLDFFESFENQREASGVALDHSRFDLNANGYTGGSEAETGFSPFGRFDLDADREFSSLPIVQTIEGEEDEFDERALTDARILCYYGYSDLYSGDLVERDRLLTPACRLLAMELDFPSDIELDVQNELLVIVGDADSELGFVGLADVEIEVSVVGGSAAPSSGTTDEFGFFSTQVTATLEGALEIEVRALAGDGRKREKSVIANAGFSSLTLSAPASVEAGPSPVRSVIPISGTLRDESGLPVSGGAVSLSITSPGAAFPSGATATTEADGSFLFEYGTFERGEIVIVASALGADPVEAVTFILPPTPFARGDIGFFIDATRFDCTVVNSPLEVDTGAAYSRSADCTAGTQGVVTLTARVEFEEPQVLSLNNRVSSVRLRAHAEADWANLTRREYIQLDLAVAMNFFQIDAGTINVDYQLEGNPSPSGGGWQIGTSSTIIETGVPPSGQRSFEFASQNYVSARISDGGLGNAGLTEISGTGSLQRTITLVLTVAAD